MIAIFADHACTIPISTVGVADAGKTQEVTIFARNNSTDKRYEVKISLQFPFAQLTGELPNIVEPGEVIPVKIVWSPDNIDWKPGEEYRSFTGELVVSRKFAGAG